MLSIFVFHCVFICSPLCLLSAVINCVFYLLSSIVFLFSLILIVLYVIVIVLYVMVIVFKYVVHCVFICCH
ncbi:hypothetical protein Hanom_Chr16g01419651 [Helianthus anomalus]